MRDCPQIKRFDKLNLMIFNNKNVAQKARLARPLTTSSVMASRWRCGLAIVAPLILAITSLGAAAALFDDSFVIEKNQLTMVTVISPRRGWSSMSLNHLVSPSSRIDSNGRLALTHPKIVSPSKWICGSSCEHRKEDRPSCLSRSTQQAVACLAKSS